MRVARAPEATLAPLVPLRECRVQRLLKRGPADLPLVALADLPLVDLAAPLPVDLVAPLLVDRPALAGLALVVPLDRPWECPVVPVVPVVLVKSPWLPVVLVPALALALVLALALLPVARQ
jgi:hypothetical protein